MSQHIQNWIEFVWEGIAIKETMGELINHHMDHECYRENIK